MVSNQVNFFDGTQGLWPRSQELVAALIHFYMKCVLEILPRILRL
jgi:hypothetical protein